jgi:hypothetical protein
MSKEKPPQLFPNFKQNPPNTSPFIIHPYDDEPATDEETKNALRLLNKQIFKAQTVSRDMIYDTKFIVLLRPLELLPKVKDQKSIYGFDWFVGHYDWNMVISKTMELQEKFTVKLSIFLVPTLGQCIQGSNRFELTYNAFIAPDKMPPFTELIERKESEAEGKEVDEELFKKSDPIEYKSLQSLGLEWRDAYKFDEKNVEGLKDFTIKVYMLTATSQMMTNIKRMGENDLALWYDTVMANFLPLIPVASDGEGKISEFPLEITDPIETTIPSYTKLMATVHKINEVIGGEERAIANTMNYWQFTPAGISYALKEFINNNIEIPQSSKEFNELFVEMLTASREFIVDDIFASFLTIKRKLVPDDPDDPEERDIAEEPAMWRGSQAEIDWEMDFFDEKANKLYGKRPEVIEVLNELKEQIPSWFQGKPVALYEEFKIRIKEELIKMLSQPQVVQYMERFKEQNQNVQRNIWLREVQSRNAMFTLWPTVYQLTGLVDSDPANPLLEQIDTDIKTGAHVAIPATRGGHFP